MAIAMTMKEFLDENDIDYEVLEHPRTSTTSQIAKVAHIPDMQLAKSVMLEDEDGRYRLAVIPANLHVDLGKLHHRYKSRIGLTTEEKLGDLFDDCVLGAIPVTGQAYGFDVVWDDKLGQCTDVYFEAGDHRHLIHTTGRDFVKMMSNADHCMLTALE